MADDELMMLGSDEVRYNRVCVSRSHPPQRLSYIPEYARQTHVRTIRATTPSCSYAIL